MSCIEETAEIVFAMVIPVRSMTSRPTASPDLADHEFVPQATFDAWQRVGDIVRTGGLAWTRDGRSYVLQDALRVLGRRDGETDPYGFTGRVAPLGDLVRQGSIVSSDGLRVGAAVYDVQLGVIAVPLGGAAPTLPRESTADSRVQPLAQLAPFVPRCVR